MDKKDEAQKTMDKAIAHATAGIFDLHQYGKKLLKDGNAKKALDVFKLNRQKHPEDTFVTYVGLARGYAANNDKKSAIKNWEIAIKNLPADQKPFLPQYEAELKKLKES
jgi:predicted Zn-dependent protease